MNAPTSSMQELAELSPQEIMKKVDCTIHEAEHIKQSAMIALEAMSKFSEVFNKHKNLSAGVIGTVAGYIYQSMALRVVSLVPPSALSDILTESAVNVSFATSVIVRFAGKDKERRIRESN